MTHALINQNFNKMIVTILHNELFYFQYFKKRKFYAAY